MEKIVPGTGKSVANYVPVANVLAPSPNAARPRNCAQSLRVDGIDHVLAAVEAFAYPIKPTAGTAPVGRDWEKPAGIDLSRWIM